MALEQPGEPRRLASRRRSGYAAAHLAVDGGFARSRRAVDVAAGEQATTVYRALSARGLRPHEAANVTAYLEGLAPVEGGWAIDEIEHLLFLRHLVRHRHISG
jgi:hypothetical protein